MSNDEQEVQEMTTKTYQTEMVCSNCGLSETMTFSHGTEAVKQPCPKCGCKTLKRGNPPLLFSFPYTSPISRIETITLSQYCSICGCEQNGGQHCALRHAAHDNPTVTGWLLSCSCPQCSPRC